MRRPFAWRLALNIAAGATEEWGGPPRPGRGPRVGAQSATRGMHTPQPKGPSGSNTHFGGPEWPGPCWTRGSWRWLCSRRRKCCSLWTGGRRAQGLRHGQHAEGHVPEASRAPTERSCRATEGVCVGGVGGGGRSRTAARDIHRRGGGGGPAVPETVVAVAQSSFKLLQFSCLKGSAMSNQDDTPRIHLLQCSASNTAIKHRNAGGHVVTGGPSPRF